MKIDPKIWKAEASSRIPNTQGWLGRTYRTAP